MKKIKKGLAIAAATVIAGCTVTGCQKDTGPVFGTEQAQGTEALKVADYSVKQDLFYLYLMQYVYNAGLKSGEVNDSVKQQALDATVEEIQLEMVQYQLAQVTEGVEVREEDQEEAKQNAENFCKVFTPEFLGLYGITQETVEQLFEQQAYVTALSDKTVEDLSKEYYAKYEDEYKDLVFHSVYYVLFPSVKYDENGELVKDSAGNAVSLSAGELEEQEKKAEEVRKRAVAGESMEELAKEYHVEYCSGMERNYDGAYEESLNKVLEDMNTGDISDVVQTNAGYMVVRMDNKNDEDYKAYWMQYMAYSNAQSLLPNMQQNWLSAAGLSEEDLNQDVMRAVDLKRLCKQMENYNIRMD